MTGNVFNVAGEDFPGLVRQEFIFTEAPFPECHASTICETGDFFVAAWFGGTREGHKDVGIWVSRLRQGKWSPPVEVATGVQDDGKPYPCWNPVLFQPAGGPLLLFYKVGPSPSRWWGLMMTSSDNGESWSKPSRLPEGILGPIKNKPVQLSGGDLLCPSSSEDKGWRIHFERTSDLGRTWSRTEPLNGESQLSAIQPSILKHDDGKLQAIGRTKQGVIFQVWSMDVGKTWGTLSSLNLPNPNSGIDGVTLSNGKQLVVYNHTRRGRTPLNVAVSNDGKNWEAAAVLEQQAGEFSYPAVIQGSNGEVHITYTWKRERIKHVVLIPAGLKPRAIVDGKWPE